MMHTMTGVLQQTKRDADYKTIVKSGTRFFFIASGVLFLAYLYCVGTVTFTVLARRSLEQELKVQTSEMSRQELSFLQTQKTLTKEYAREQGFVEPVAISFTAPKRALAWNAGY